MRTIAPIVSGPSTISNIQYHSRELSSWGGIGLTLKLNKKKIYTYLLRLKSMLNFNFGIIIISFIWNIDKYFSILALITFK